MSVDDIICKLIEQEDDFSDIDPGTPLSKLNEPWKKAAVQSLQEYYGRRPSGREVTDYLERLLDFIVERVKDDPEEFATDWLNGKTKLHLRSFFSEMPSVLLGPRE